MIIKSINSDAGLWKKVVIAPVIDTRPDKIVFSEKQMDKLYEIALKCKDNSMSREEAIAELRGGDIKDYVKAFAVIGAILSIIANSDAFQVPLPPPGAIPPPHLAWLYESTNMKPFGYDSSRSLTMIDATRNGSSEKKIHQKVHWIMVRLCVN